MIIPASATPTPMPAFAPVDRPPPSAPFELVAPIGVRDGREEDEDADADVIWDVELAESEVAVMALALVLLVY